MTHEYTDYSIFVGDLDQNVDDVMLEHTFKTYYPSTKGAKVMVDPATGRSRGFGFVRFTSEAERDRAMQEMNGVYVGAKQIRCSLATQKPKPGSTQTGQPPGGPSGGGSSLASTGTASTRRDTREERDTGEGGQANNTTLFIGGLSSSVSEAELHTAFARCGEIVYVKIPPGKGCGFVQYVTRSAAEYALEQLNGLNLGGMPIRISWGKSTKAPPPHAAGPPGHHHPPPQAGAYPPTAYYGAGYEAYPPAAYGAYGYGMDPYGYGAYADPYAAARMGYAGYPGHPMPGTAAHMAHSAAVAAAGAMHGSGPATHPGGTVSGPVQPVLYDPLVPVNVDKMNMAFMHRQVPYLTGTYVRVPVAMAPAMAAGMAPAMAPQLAPGSQPQHHQQHQQQM